MTVQTVEGKLYAQPVKIAPVMETLEKGAKVLVLHQKGDWYAVSLPDQRLGWAHQSIFTPEKTIAKTEPPPRAEADEASAPAPEDETPEASASLAAGQNAVLKVASGRVRNAPSRDAGLAFGLIKGDPFTVLAKQGDWYQIRTAKDQTGWVYHTLVQFLSPAPPSVPETPEAGGEDSAPTATENAAAVEGPPSQSEDAESEAEDGMASADSTSSESEDAAVETENAAASAESAPSENKKAPAEDQEPVAAAGTVPPEAEKAATTPDGGFTVALKVRSGRVRTGPSLSSPTAFSIPRGTRARVTETEGGWHHILLPDGRTGWSYKTMFDIVGEKDVIAPEAPENAGAAESAPPVVAEKTMEKQTAAVKEVAAPPQSEAPAAKEIKGIRFKITPEGDENIVFELDAFNPPKTYTVDDNNVPKVVCEFADTRLSPGIGKSVSTNGKLVKALSIRQPGGGNSPIRVEASLDPRFQYSVDQVFFKKTNLYIITFKK